ncbi:DUF397 domain-containing protein [Nocardia cyriacigeorgica]|uniref:DUF397 domain-containing protein n=1 Tax=Nocardia cyriacigeorgica TaxID=135487 RepID=UPI001894BE81|nr:DUF397 domain-containing protein [Nocardia cyriacigeorgica]MBF6085150.1 DUF397 domain-containing protein [Nocardia cyriacigeorgica]
MTTNIHRRRWTKSKHSGNNGGACVEAIRDGETVYVRDSKFSRQNPDANPETQPTVAVPCEVWDQVLAAALNMDSAVIPLGNDRDVLSIEVARDGSATVTSHGQAVTLAYTPAEWDAFSKGVADGEFYPSNL